MCGGSRSGFAGRRELVSEGPGGAEANHDLLESLAAVVGAEAGATGVRDAVEERSGVSKTGFRRMGWRRRGIGTEMKPCGR